MVAERYNTCLVFLPHRDIRKHQRGIDGIIKVGHTPESLLHHPTLINDIENLLRTLVLIYIHHQSGSAGCGSPVDQPEIIARNVILDLFEFRMIAHLPYFLDTHFRKIVAHSQQFITGKHQIGRIHLDITRLAQSKPTLYQTYRCGSENTDMPKGINSTLRRT